MARPVTGAMTMRAILTSLLLLGLSLTPRAQAETLTLAPVKVTDWKAVFGRIEARDRLPARARLGGTLVELAVNEGDLVTAGDVIGPDRRRKAELPADGGRRAASARWPRSWPMPRPN